MSKDRYIFSPIKRKMLLLLLAGVILSFIRSPRTQRMVFKTVRKEWKMINRRYLYAIIREFRRDRLINYQEIEDGIVRIELTEKGKKRALAFNIDNITIKHPFSWDGKWRIVIFDIPEKKRQGRDALRNKIKELGFYELQKSVWVYPFPCKDEIDFIVEFFELRNYVRYGELVSLTLEEELLKEFDLSLPLLKKIRR